MKANPRHTSRLEALPAAQRQQLDAWLREGLTYGEIVGRVALDFGVKTALSSLSNYFSRHLAQPNPGESQVRNLSVSQETIEFEIVTRVRIRRADLAALTADQPTQKQ